MAFDIHLAICNDDEHVLNKTLMDTAVLNGVLRDESSIINPEIMIEREETYLDDTNYLYFNWGDRNMYYFIEDMIFYRTGVVICKCRLDPLMSYSAEIRNVEATIERNQYDSDAYLMDENYHIDACSNIVTLDFPTGFTDETMILLTVG